MTDGRRSEGDPQRAGFGDRYSRIAGYYVRGTIAERCRWGAAAVGEHQSARLLGYTSRPDTNTKRTCGGEVQIVIAPARRCCSVYQSVYQ